MKLLAERIQSRLLEFKRLIYEKKQPLSHLRIAPDSISAPKDFSSASPVWQSITPGACWPEFSSYYWLQVPIQIPEEWADCPVDLILQISKEYTLLTPEGLVYVNGKLRQGVDRNHDVIHLTQSAVPGEKFETAVRIYSGEPFSFLPTTPTSPHQLVDCSIGLPNEWARRFYSLANTLVQVTVVLPPDSRLRWDYLNALGDSFNRIDYRYPRSPQFYQSVQGADEFLRNKIAELRLPPALEKVACVGHAHIDVAWLWTLQRTREKAVQTFSTALELMKRYPDYHFFQSQPQLYRYVQEDQPELWQAIRARIQEGRWEADGAMWVEADCNLTSGESLVRQFLYGHQYFTEQLGVKCSILWLPDVFGYSWALPQIMRKCEVPYFMTTKISWNQFNPMPYDSFRWRGVDGSEVVTHFITTPSDQWFKTYNGLLTPAEIQGTWKAYQQKSCHDEVLLAFGYGDGGGGPTEEMLQTADALKNLPGFPQVQIGRADQFFQRLETKWDQLPIWNGELYLEYHRGTYTSQAQNKKWNREAELRMQQIEFIATLAALSDAKYPRESLRKIWGKILLNQFHDILPGSAVHAVYEESARDYQWIRQESEKILEASGKTITQTPENSENLITLINTLGWQRLEGFAIPNPGISRSLIAELESCAVSLQPFESIAGEKKVWIQHAQLPSFSAATLKWGNHEIPADSNLKITDRSLENRLLRLELNSHGEIISLYDKENHREILLPGEPANVFQAFEDKPIAHDAWDIDIFYQDKLLSTGEAAEIQVADSGPLRATLRVTKKILEGTIIQNISLYRDSRCIDFDTRVEWSNKDVLLKVAFPVAIHAAAATYDIQFGNVARATHWNTSWDWAKFETCAHKWVDLSEGNYGVSLMNNCKYGHDIRDHVIRLTLLKCASAPDPSADVGTHFFAYSLYPHAGDWRAARIPQRAYEFNVSPLALHGRFHHPQLNSNSAFVTVNCENVILETIKWAESEEAVILRLYECYNQRGPVVLQFFRNPKKVMECNLLERDEQSIEIKENTMEFSITPYQIRTFKVWW